jgi:hypothetical protein
MASSDSPERGFEFFRERALDGESFTLEELENASGWSRSSIDTYRSKQWKELLEKGADGAFCVRREFLRLTKAEFLDHITQKRPLFAKYRRRGYDSYVMFEFLIPLTRESQLRAALDELFYADTMEQRLREIGISQLESTISREDSEDDEEYLERVVRLAADRFGGYSISHVSGRYKAATLRSRQDALAHVLDGGRYLIDETTATVRFVVPCKCTEYALPDSLSDAADIGSPLSEAKELHEEVVLIRRLFFMLFVETVVRTIKGEDEIWLLEEGVAHRLYVWERVP